jgi:hypothetical protein
MLDPRRARRACRIWPSCISAADGKNADPDRKAINVLIWLGDMWQRRRGLRAISGAGAILMLDDAGGNPRSRRLRS